MQRYEKIPLLQKKREKLFLRTGIPACEGGCSECSEGGSTSMGILNPQLASISLTLPSLLAYLWHTQTVCLGMLRVCLLHIFVTSGVCTCCTLESASVASGSLQMYDFLQNAFNPNRSLEFVSEWYLYQSDCLSGHCRRSELRQNEYF